MRLRRFLILILIGSVSAVVVLSLYAAKIEFLSGLDLKLKDSRLKLKKPSKPDQRVVIAAIDPKSINELGRWPWDRKIMASLIEGISFYGAKTIALDIIFAEPSSPESDSALSESIAKSGNVIAGYYFRHEEEAGQSRPELIEPSKLRVLRVQEGVTEVPFETFPEVETNIEAIARSAHSAGYFNVVPDKDGIFRNANLLMLYNGDVYPSLSLSALRHYLESEIMLDIAQYGADSLYIGRKKIPIDESGRLTINYYGKAGSFRTIPAVDIIKRRLEDGSLKDCIVFVGPTEIGISDIRATPVDPVLPGVEIHATVASNVLTDHYLIRDGRVIGLELFFITAFPLLLVLGLGIVRKTLFGLMLFTIAIGLYMAVNYVCFSSYLLNTSVIYPLISTALAYAGSETYRNLIEEQKSRFLKKAFSSYVSPELVGEMMKNPDILKLGGEKKDITVLFSDIRGFTTLSEKLSPENLVLLLNQYLDPMTRIILTHKGMLDKYIGDAIMAIYNAPLDVPDHSALACKSALEMLEKLKSLNASFRERGFEEIDIGIGINTGEAIVGNMGTDVRFDYTAIGDTVNLASRLEGMCKVYKTHIIVSEFTVQHIAAMPDSLKTGLIFRELDMIRVKGKDRPVRIFELLPLVETALLEDFSRALALYRQREFNKASEIFESLQKRFNDGPSAIYLERCTEFIKTPPPTDWDGVYTAKTK